MDERELQDWCAATAVFAVLAVVFKALGLA
jgi:hypothetical protein